MAINVWMYLDEFTSMTSESEADRLGIEGDNPGLEYEYRQLEKLFVDAMPKKFKKALKFKRYVDPAQLNNAKPDFYVWDIGGMCMVDIGGERRWNWSSQVIRSIIDHPNTGFIPFSDMTLRDARSIVQEMIDDSAWDFKEPPPNLFLLDSKDAWDGLLEDKVSKWVKGFIKDWK